MAGKFSFFESFWEAAQDLSDKDRLAFYDAVTKYAFTGEEPSFKGLMSTIWKLVKPNLDSSIKGQQTGRSGGRGNTAKPPVSNNQNPPFSNPETPMETVMDKEMDMEGDMEREAEVSFPLEEKKPSAYASGGAVTAKAAPPSAKPYCPICNEPMWRNTQTGKWRCDVCFDSFTDEKAVWR